ncbi:MAG TPA: branched-chain amino acid ABC transporter permease [Pseudolysinimonas sp.]|nr:branched-chain amino acid ABC transporter permease [Pseudolysinimonas sp.]
MSELLSLILNGLSVGAIYALIALGMVIVFKATEVINFAHPSLLVVGTLIVATLVDRFHLPFFLAAGIGIVATAILGIVINLVLVRPFHKKQAVLAAGIMTFGLALVIDTITSNQIGAQIISPGGPWGATNVDVLGTTLPLSRIVAVSVAGVLLVAFYIWLQRSDFGVGMRAAADDPETASLMGVRLSRVSLFAWGIASALAVVAGVFLVSYPSAGLEVTVSGIALQAIPAAVIGGLDSTTGAVVGGLAVGLTQVLALGYQDELAFLGRSFYQAAPYILMLIVLLIRPAGLFGTKDVSRV